MPQDQLIKGQGFPPQDPSEDTPKGPSTLDVISGKLDEIKGVLEQVSFWSEIGGMVGEAGGKAVGKLMKSRRSSRRR
jgi:hypothetical protein